MFTRVHSCSLVFTRVRSCSDSCGVLEQIACNLDICVLRRLRLRQGQMQGFLGLKVGGGGLNLQIWDLNRAHETERTICSKTPHESEHE